MQKPKRHGVAWSDEEDAELRRRCEAGEFIEEIAKHLGRSGESVRTRANVLAIPCRSGRSASRSRTPKSAMPSRGGYRLVCMRADGEVAEQRDLNAADDAAAVAAAKACGSTGGCEVWRIGADPQLLGRF